MADNSTVTLSFVADTRRFDSGMRQVQTAAAQTDKAILRSTETMATWERAERAATAQALTTSKAFRDVAASGLLISGSLPPAAQKMTLTAMAAGDLTKAAIMLRPKLEGLKYAAVVAAGGITAAGVAAGALVAAIGAAGVAISAHIDHTGPFNEINRTAADTTYYLAKAVDFVGQKIPVLGGLLDKGADKADNWSRHAHGMAGAAYDLADGVAAANHQLQINMGYQFDSKGNVTYDPTAGPDFDAFSYSDQLLSGTLGGSSAYMQSLQDAADAAAKLQSNASKAARGVRGSASTVKSAQNDAAQMLLQGYQSLYDASRQVALGIGQAFAPVLNATFDNGQNKLLTMGPNAHKSGVLAGLQQQLADTKRLSKDLDALSKRGLSAGLLSTLAQGGTASLPAAEQLLQGNNVAQANSAAKGINKYANQIAQGEITRQQKLNVTSTVKFDLSHGESDLKKLIRKWVRVEGGGNVQLALGGKR